MTNAAEFLRYLADSLTEHIVVIDLEGTIQYVNSAWVVFGEENGAALNMEWSGKNYLDVCDAAAKQGDADGIKAAQGIRAVMGTQDVFHLEYPCHSPKEKRWFMMSITPLEWQGPRQLVITHKNITERKLAEERTTSLSLLDGLTGISNRRHFDFFLENEWRRALRQKKPISLVMVDVDFFKAFNDHYGHQAGDECLKKVGECLQNFGNRPGDLVARYGGEEFAVILADAELEHAARIAENIRRSINDLEIPHEYSEVHKNVTASAGVSTSYPRNGASEKQLIQAADEALYKSKKTGRNRVTAA